MWEYGIIQFLIMGCSFYHFGFLYGVGFIILLVKAIHFILDKMGFELLRFNDVTHFLQEKGTFSNIVSYLVLDKIDFDTFKKHVLSNKLLSNRRMNQKIVRKFGFHLWRDLPTGMTKNQIKNSPKKLKTKQEIIEFANELLITKLDYDKPLWEFHLVEDYSKEHSVLFVRVHHGLVDGVGVLSIMTSFIDDAFSVKNSKSFIQKSFFVDLFFTIFGPFYALFI